jgi:hypothetical protein
MLVTAARWIAQLSTGGPAQKLAGLATIGDLSVRFERVRLSLDSLEAEEKLEVTASRPTGPYSTPLIGGVHEQIEQEFGTSDAEPVPKTSQTPPLN